MADNVDIAGEYLERLEVEREKIREAERRQRAEAAARGSAAECGECGDAIPQARRKAQPGCRFCVDCQSEAERRRVFAA